MPLGDYKNNLDSDSAFSNLKRYSLKVGFETIPNGGYVLKTGLTKRWMLLKDVTLDNRIIRLVYESG